VARGVIIRRPRVVNMAERIDADRRAVKRMQRLRSRYGRGPVRLPIPFRPVAFVLHPDDVNRVLDETPEAFTTANVEKVAALSHFQPKAVLISTGAERADRRRFNEAVLDVDAPVHRRGDDITVKVVEEVDRLLATAERSGRLTWDDFAVAWYAMVRRVVLGDAARDDHEVTDMIAALRADANWAFARPKRTELRDRFHARLAEYVERAEPGSLAHLVATTPSTGMTAPVQQIPHWLFAFDAAAWASFRALALVDAHPDHAAAVAEELAGRDLSMPHELPLLRATVLESLRLWPTTPAVLRDTTRETTWATGSLPKKTAIVVFAPFFHRDDEHLDSADRLDPGLWSGERTDRDWPLIPFSGGPGVCPGRNLVLLTTSSFLGRLLAGHELHLDPRGRLDGSRPLPGTLSPFTLRFRPVRRPASTPEPGAP
jgi:cytochrome P450